MNADLAKAIRQAAGSRLEATLALQMAAAKLPPWETEYRFDPARRYRLDFFFPAARLGVELQGGTWVAGGHSRGRGYQRDCDKLAACTLAGIRVLWFTTDDVTSGKALTVIEAALAQFSPPDGTPADGARMTVQPLKALDTPSEPYPDG